MYLLIASPPFDENPLLNKWISHLETQTSSICVYFSNAEDAATFSANHQLETVLSLDDLSEPPSLILGQSHLDMMIALTRFPKTPGVYFYSDFGWNAEPPITPQIGLYFVTRTAEYNHLRYHHGIAENLVMHELAFPNLDSLTELPIPKEPPQRALVVTPTRIAPSLLDTLHHVGTKENLEIDILELSQLPPSLPNLLAAYDIVFACDKIAALSMALSRVVILWHPRGAGTLITPTNLDSHLQTNFRVTSNYDGEITLNRLGYELAQYNTINNHSMAMRVREYYAEQTVLTRVMERFRQIEATALESPPEFQSQYLQWLAQSIPLKIAAEERLSSAIAAHFRQLYEQALVEKQHLDYRLKTLHEMEVELMVLKDQQVQYQAAALENQQTLHTIELEKGELQTTLHTIEGSWLFRHIVVPLWHIKQWLLPQNSWQVRLFSNLRRWRQH